MNQAAQRIGERLTARALQRGFTIVELMVSMVIGLVVLGAMYSAYVSQGSSTRVSQTVSQMAEDASIGFSLLRSHVGMAAFSRPVAPAGGGGGGFQRAASNTTRWIFGCDRDFADLSVALTALTCSATPGTLDSLAVGYEADQTNSITKTVGGVVMPMDCLGNTFPLTVDGAFSYYLSYSRFYVSNGSLFCRGPGNAAGQALIENVQDMQVQYGVGGAVAPNTTRVVQYLNAADVTTAAAWGRVLSVRVCLVMRSATPILDEVTSYQGCDPFADPITPADRRLYRAFTTTIVLTNRMGVTL